MYRLFSLNCSPLQVRGQGRLERLDRYYRWERLDRYYRLERLVRYYRLERWERWERQYGLFGLSGYLVVLFALLSVMHTTISPVGLPHIVVHIIESLAFLHFPHSRLHFVEDDTVFQTRSDFLTGLSVLV